MPASEIKALDAANGTLEISQGSTDQSTLKKIGLITGTGKVVSAFNLNLTGSGNNSIHQLGQSVTVTVQLTGEQISALKGTTPALYYYDPSTGSLVDMHATFDLSKGTVTFTTSHFSTYVIGQAVSSAKVSNPSTGNNKNVPVTLIILLSIAAVTIPVVIVFKRLKTTR